jgi:hypothetical protein
LAALQNTVGDRGIVIPGDVNTNTWKQKALEQIYEIIAPEKQNPKTSDVRNNYIMRNYDWAIRLSWKSQAEKLVGQYFDKQGIEYRGLYNPFLNKAQYQDDLKVEAMEEIYNYYRWEYKKPGGFEPLKVLEVGTRTGASLLKLVKGIPHSVGYGLDVFDECGVLEDAFKRNAATVKTTNRVELVKGDSVITMTNYWNTRQKFDLIYVDGEETVEMRVLDLWLAWNILNRGGILITNMFFYDKGGSGRAPVLLFIQKLQFKEFEFKEHPNGLVMFKKI